MNIRAYAEADLDAVVALFIASVHELGAPHYSAAQRLAWAPRSPDMQAWVSRLAELRTLLLLGDSGLLGFIAFDDSGHVDLLFTAPTAARRGVASRLLARLAHELPDVELFTESSLIAQPFFLRHGFRAVEEQWVVRRGVAFPRVAMRRGIGLAPKLELA